MHHLKIPAFLGLLLFSFPASRASETVVYKQVDQQSLKLWIDKPAGWKATDKLPGIVFFFGGGWVGGTPEQFSRQSMYFAGRGMIGIRVEYRTISKDGGGLPVVCCEDAKSAMRYVRSHAAELGMDPDRIAGAGGSAGGHLAAFTALVEGLDDPKDDKAVSCKPNALVLFNPVFDNGPGSWGHDRLGSRYKEFSPAHHVAKGAPPTIVFVGDSDKLLPVGVVKAYQSRMEKAGARCELRIYPGKGHGFFNRQPYLNQTLSEADKFLTSLGWLRVATTPAGKP